MNPSEKNCWKTCGSCWRCADKGKYPAKCGSCSGRNDPYERRSHDPDDYCRCTEGILQIVTKDGRFIQRKFQSSPFATKVYTDAETEDERDWNAYLNEKREQLDDPNFDPLRFDDGSSVAEWTRGKKWQ